MGIQENSRKSIGFRARPEIWRGVSEISGGFWKQNHEEPAWRELAGPASAAPKLTARPGRPRDFRNSLVPKNPLKNIFSGTPKTRLDSNQSKSLIPMQQKLGPLLHFTRPNENSQCKMPTRRPRASGEPNV